MSKNVDKRNTKRTAGTKPKTISYRLKCAKTANGLSHFVMYGDAQKGKTLL
ncbi:MAG: hypothetical protein V1933_02905 [Candidatus Omnitrophota bacterium]